MAVEVNEVLLISGRFLLGGLFVAGGIKHCFTYSAILEAMIGRGVPYPEFTLIAGSIFQAVFGLTFIFGIAVPLSAACLTVFTIAASIMLLNFWDLEPGPAREGLMNAFLTNVALIGGLLIAAACSL